MNKLLHANLIRLWKNKAFWIGSIVSVLLIVGACLNQYILLRKYGTEAYGDLHPDSFMVGSIFFLGVIFSVFSGLFVGTECYWWMASLPA